MTPVSVYNVASVRHLGRLPVVPEGLVRYPLQMSIEILKQKWNSCKVTPPEFPKLNSWSDANWNHVRRSRADITKYFRPAVSALDFLWFALLFAAGVQTGQD